MKTYFSDPGTLSWILPKSMRDDDVRLSEAVVERFITEFTETDDVVFDPFAGFGTVPVVAERLGRIGLGYEILDDRAAYANSLLSRGEVRTGDVRQANLADIRAKLILSSPPYMNSGDKEDPLSGYRHPVDSYESYIDALASIYIDLEKILSPGGKLVIQLQNLRNAQGVTPLVFDLHAAIGSRVKFEGEEITTWETPSYGYTHGYCLVYGRGDNDMPSHERKVGSE